MKFEILGENGKSLDLEQSGFELGISDYQTDALDHSASLVDVGK